MKDEKFEHSERNVSEDEMSRYMEVREGRKRKRKREKWLFGLLTAVLLLAMGISFRLFWTRMGQNTPETQETLADTVIEEDSPDITSSIAQPQAPEEETAEEIAIEARQEEPPAEESGMESEIPAPDEAEAAEDEILMPENAAVSEDLEIEKIPEEDSDTVKEAKRCAAQYDYDKALSILRTEEGFESDAQLQALAEEIQKEKDSCQAWPVTEVTHVFFHTLIRDPSLAFDGDKQEAGYNQYMTTITEFQKITQSMYEKGYVMVSIRDIASVNEKGNMAQGAILLPPGKIPFVLSQDDVCYYHYMDGDGMAEKLVIDEDGRIRTTYREPDGSVSVGDYDLVPLIDRFVEEYPDFSYRGAKGIIALTGYDGILGYRTDITYQTKPDDMDDNKKVWLEEHPDFDLTAERAEAKKVAEAMKAEGWLFASHTWGHLNVGEVSLDRLKADTVRFQENVDPLIGGTDIIIFAFGGDISGPEEYSGRKYKYLKKMGYHYFCNVDSSKYFVQLTKKYLRMGRRNLDGYRMYYNPEMLSDLFNVSDVFDPARPTPVLPMSK